MSERCGNWQVPRRRLAALAALVALTTAATAETRHCALFREEVKGVMDAVELAALSKGPRGSAAYHAIRREGYRALSRGLAEHRAWRDARDAQAAGQLNGQPGAAAEAPGPEPTVCFDTARMTARIDPADAAPARHNALDGLLTALAEQLTSELPKSQGIQPRVFNGSAPGPCNNLDTVAILDTRNQLVCSGLLVDRRHVLSAAHCVCQMGGGGGTVVLGETVHASRPDKAVRRAAVPIDPSGTRTPIEDPCLSSERRRGADIALFRLAGDLRVDEDCKRRIRDEATRNNETVVGDHKLHTARIAPVAAILDPSVTTVRVSGFGRTEFASIGEKLFAHVGVYSRICGPEVISRRFRCVAGRETMLVDPAGLRDTCGGDSGGPVYLKSGRKFLAYAITSRGLPGGECRAGGIYTLITPAVVNWMRRNGVEVDVSE